MSRKLFEQEAEAYEDKKEKRCCGMSGGQARNYFAFIIHVMGSQPSTPAGCGMERALLLLAA